MERLFSAFSYLDTAVVQSRVPDNVERILQCYKELPREENFGLETATFIWSTMEEKHRRIVTLSPADDMPIQGKHLIKPMEEIKNARGRKKTFLTTNQQAQYAGEDDIDFETHAEIEVPEPVAEERYGEEGEEEDVFEDVPETQGFRGWSVLGEEYS